MSLSARDFLGMCVVKCGWARIVVNREIYIGGGMNIDPSFVLFGVRLMPCARRLLRRLMPGRTVV